MGMANPMIVLLSFQDSLRQGGLVDPGDLVQGYLSLCDHQPRGPRITYVKIENGEAEALAIFGAEDPIKGLQCFSVGYAVCTGHRGKGLALEAVEYGIGNLIRLHQAARLDGFYVEAVIAQTNIPSLNVARKIFSNQGQATVDAESGTPALFFQKYIQA